MEMVILAIVYYVFLVLCSLLRGSKNFPSLVGLDPCKGIAWGIIGMQLLLSLAISKLLILRIQRQNQPNPELPLISSSSVPTTNEHKLVLIGFIAGFIGAALGIGGGILFMPIWLDIGITKEVAANTTPILILTSAMISFAISLLNGYYDHVPYWKFVMYFGISFGSSAVVKGNCVTYM
jgi:uncharacterized membrane protein YfcA